MVQPVDLTLEISNKLPSFPGSPRPQFITWADRKSDGYNLELIFLSSHSGTHLDAPFHFIEKGLKIDKIPLSRLMVDATLCSVKKGPDEAITRRDIVHFEVEHGKITPKSAVVFRTGWSKNISRKDYFTRNPGLDPSAARYLSERRIGLVGIDSPSIDLGRDSGFSGHRILLKSGTLILENLCNLGKIKGTSFRLIVLPLRLKGGTGSPVRAVAI